MATNIACDTPASLCDDLGRSRGRWAFGPIPLREATAKLSSAKNLIKQHMSQLASDRTSCRWPLANQVRLIPSQHCLLCAALTNPR
jgi:hypothetical protein